MNEKQLAEDGFLHLECPDFDAALKEEPDGSYTIAKRNYEWVPGEGMTRGEWVKSDSFRFIRGIRKELYIPLRDRFSERLIKDLESPCKWETFILFPISGQLLVIAEHFNEYFLWDCQENVYPLDKVPQAKVLPNGNLDFSKTLDYLRAWSNNQRRRNYTREIQDNRHEYDIKGCILKPMWGFDPDEEYYGNKNSFEVEEIVFKPDPKRGNGNITLKLGKSQSGHYSIGINIWLSRSGCGIGASIWNERGYASRGDALSAVIREAREWIEKSDDDSQLINKARKWLNAQEAELAQLNLF